MGSTEDQDKGLTYEEMSRYFTMPILDAAKELHVGITTMKKRCRRLGITRWPYRKLKSLENMINSVPELSQASEVGEKELKLATEMLREEREMIQRAPAMELEENTKKLRQAFFKHKYNRTRGGYIPPANPRTGQDSGVTVAGSKSGRSESDNQTSNQQQLPIEASRKESIHGCPMNSSTGAYTTNI